MVVENLAQESYYHVEMKKNMYLFLFNLLTSNINVGPKAGTGRAVLLSKS